MAKSKRNQRKAAQKNANKPPPAPVSAAPTAAPPAPPPPPAYDPAFVEAMNDGMVLHQKGQIEESIAAFRRAMAINPTHALSYGNLGALLADRGQSEEAIEMCRKAIELDPNLSLAHNNLGLALAKLERHTEAVAAFSQAITIQPENAGAMTNMTRSLIQVDRLEEAERVCRQAIALKPDNAKAHSNYGMFLEAVGRLDESIALFRQAIALGPNLPPARKNLGLALMHKGEFAEGWREYEWRWAADGLNPRNYPKPLWRGEPIPGKTLLLYTEQGLGDAIHFARFVPLLAGNGVRVILEVHPPLMRLMRSLPGVADVIALWQTPPPFDCYQAAMSLPGILGITPKTIPALSRYLAAKPELVAKWRNRLGAHGFKVGIVWQGKANTTEEGARSAPLAHFAPLAAIKGVRLISLQKQAADAKPDPLIAQLPVETLGPEFDSGPDAFIDTAAVMENLDLVITIDTSLAHLAGALGRPVWIALKHVPDWRWTMTGAQSPWYPTARLFRQPTRGDWAPPFAQITEALRTLAASATAQN